METLGIAFIMFSLFALGEIYATFKIEQIEKTLYDAWLNLGIPKNDMLIMFTIFLLFIFSIGIVLVL